jgi:PilZ domain
MSGERPLPPGPVEFDPVQIVDRLSGSRVSATVESVRDRCFVLRLKSEAALPEEGFLRWFDGVGAWQGIVQMERIDTSRVRCELAPPDEWQATVARRSTRIRVDNSPLLVRLLPGERRVHAVCVDISDTGCRANWLGQTPRAGDAVAVTWDVEPARAELPDWIPARVVRVIPRPFGAHHICFSFEFADERQAALVRKRHEASLRAIRPRGRAA